ncbi:Plant self-incompatibility S1 [Corchorus capsularis]|uniref:S-protein homolog n=1 Tax=Corchorus capsularis TaxID=210143 RepID=A0A1R3GCZ5_COCAP|nr:Plant self-incompatibility S1 [Corchorus capsularis]
MGVLNYKSMVSLFILVITFGQIISLAAGERYQSYTIHISNELSNDQELNVHCTSKGKEVGEQVIPDHHEWSFSAHEEFSQKAEYWCDMKSPNHGSFLSFISVSVAVREQIPSFEDLEEVNGSSSSKIGLIVRAVVSTLKASKEE